MGFAISSNFALLLVWVVQNVSKILHLFPELEMRTAALEGKLYFSAVHDGCRFPGPPEKYGSAC